MWKNKKVLLGVCGGIAAYKMAFFTRLLIKAGAEVQVIMTRSSTDFITPLTLSTLSKKPVYIDFFDPKDGSWNNHVDLGLWADCMLIAPATANTLAKMAGGISDNLLLTTWLSARCPVFVAPAMDLDMWQHPASQENLDKLASWGVDIIPPGDGELASGLSGKGRMAEPEEMMAYLADKLFGKQDLPLAGKRAIVTAGPTYEAIDPVRFIGNHSSGKMGIEIADRLAEMGAEVSLVAGPTKLRPTEAGVEFLPVRSAADMYNACAERFDDCHIFIGAAAVADYTPSNPSDIKIKKKDAKPMSIELTRTKDILAEMGSRKKDQLMVGFALETNDEMANARKKLHKKNLDFIVLNSLNDKGAGFQHDTNKITIIDSSEKVVNFELKSKSAVAADIVEQIIIRMGLRTTAEV